MNLKSARIALYVGLLASAQFAGAQLGLMSNAHGQAADAAVEEYSAILEQIQNVKLATQQRRVMLETQDANAENLRAQISQVPATKAAVKGIVTEMVAEIAKVIESDLPFRKDERDARLGKMQSDLADPTTPPAELLRRAMNLYDIEANYGYSISAYTGDHPKAPGRRLAACLDDPYSKVCNLSTEQKKLVDAGASIESISNSIKDGNYVHFGRLSFIYLDLDSREGFRWSKEAGDWEPLKSGDILNARRSVRIARGESAPGVVTAPVRVQAAQ